MYPQHANDIINTRINTQANACDTWPKGFFIGRIMLSYRISWLICCICNLDLDYEFQVPNMYHYITKKTITLPKKHVRWNHVVSFNFGGIAIVSSVLVVVYLDCRGIQKGVKHLFITIHTRWFATTKVMFGWHIHRIESTRNQKIVGSALDAPKWPTILQTRSNSALAYWVVNSKPGAPQTSHLFLDARRVLKKQDARVFVCGFVPITWYHWFMIPHVDLIDIILSVFWVLLPFFVSFLMVIFVSYDLFDDLIQFKRNSSIAAWTFRPGENHAAKGGKKADMHVSYMTCHFDSYILNLSKISWYGMLPHMPDSSTSLCPRRRVSTWLPKPEPGASPEMSPGTNMHSDQLETGPTKNRNWHPKSIPLVPHKAVAKV